MSLLDKASLVQIPSGYKEDKLYSVVPDSGAGDFTFARSSTGTRVNSDGYIEEVPWNYNTNSEDLNSNTKLSIVVTSNDIISPRGTQDADKLETTSNNSYRLLKTNSISFVSGTDYTFSFYAKKGTTDFIQLITTNTLFGATSEWANFDLNNGVVSLDNYGGASIEDVGDGWYRCIMTSTCVTSGTNSWFVSIITSGTSTRAEATSSVVNVYVWGLQVVKGTSPKPYIKTTDRLDVPRLDYSGGASCASLLLEPQSTNLVTQSETFSNWNTEGGKQVVTQGVLISPDGTLNGNKLETYNSTTVSARKLWIANTVTVGASYTFSVYIKQVSGQINSGFLHITTGANDTFDVSQAYTATDQWQRVSVTTNSAASSQIRFLITGDANSQIYIWGAQVEQKSYATSYIPTSGSTVTRTADESYILNIPDVIGEEGVFFTDFVFSGIDAAYAILKLSQNNSNNDRLQLYIQGTSLIVLSRSTSGGQIGQSIESSITIGERYKVAIQYKDLDFKVYLNGTSVYTNTSVYAPDGMNQISFSISNGSTLYGFFNEIKQLSIFNEALTDTELAALTTI